MRTLAWLFSIALCTLATTAHADDQDRELFGAGAGGATGAVAGAVVGGPVGAVVGGFAGAALGAATAVPDDARVYVVENPTPSVTVQGELTTDYSFGNDVTLTPIPDHPEYAYIYVNNRPVIVRADNRQIVYAPEVETTASVSPDISETTITYIERNPVDPVVIDGELSAGMVVPDSVSIVEVPDAPTYGYIYVQDRPVLVDRESRQVIWVR